MPSFHPVQRLQRVLRFLAVIGQGSESPYATPHTSQITKVNLF